MFLGLHVAHHDQCFDEDRIQRRSQWQYYVKSYAIVALELGLQTWWSNVQANGQPQTERISHHSFKISVIIQMTKIYFFELLTNIDYILTIYPAQHFTNLCDRGKTWLEYSQQLFFVHLYVEFYRGGRLGRIAQAWWTRTRIFGLEYRKTSRTDIIQKWHNIWPVTTTIICLWNFWLRSLSGFNVSGYAWEVCSWRTCITQLWRSTRERIICLISSCRCSKL